MNRKPMICLKMNDVESRMLDVLGERLGMCKSEVLRYLVRREYEKGGEE